MNAIGRLFIGTHVKLYRASGGRIGGNFGNRRIILLTTTGRKTGLERTTPLVFIEDAAGNPAIAASNGGAPANPAWFGNLQANPEVTIQIGPSVTKRRAEIAGPEERNALWAKLTALHANFLGYEKKTTRVIPMVVLKPSR